MQIKSAILFLAVLVTNAFACHGIAQTDAAQHKRLRVQARLAYVNCNPTRFVQPFAGDAVLRAEYEQLKKASSRTTIRQKIDYMKGWISVDPRVSPVLYGMVKELAHVLAIPVPEIWIYRGNAISVMQTYLWGAANMRNNAFARKLMTENGLICIGADLLYHLNRAEIRSVIAHELGHIKGNHVRKLVTESLRDLGIIIGVTTGVGILYGISAAIITETALIYSNMFRQASRVRVCECEADAFSYQATKDPEAIVTALEKIHAISDFYHPFGRLLRTTRSAEELDSPLRTHPTVRQRCAHMFRLNQESI